MQCPLEASPRKHFHIAEFDLWVRTYNPSQIELTDSQHSWLSHLMRRCPSDYNGTPIVFIDAPQPTRMTFTEERTETAIRDLFIEECRQKAWGAACNADWIGKQMDELMAQYQKLKDEDAALDAEIEELESALDSHTKDNRDKVQGATGASRQAREHNAGAWSERHGSSTDHAEPLRQHRDQPGVGEACGGVGVERNPRLLELYLPDLIPSLMHRRRSSATILHLDPAMRL